MMNSEMEKVLIYNDEGVDRECFNETLRSINRSSIAEQVQVEAVNGTALNSTSWDERCLVFVVPGGRSTPYYELMRQSGMQRVCDYVSSGGAYLGLCAGGYFGCSRTEFELGGPLEIVRNDGLGFLAGKATGPAINAGEFCYESYAGSELTVVTLHDLPHDRVRLYYCGGAGFHPADSDEVEVLARYEECEDSPIAILKGIYGKGRFILSGIHFEVSHTSLPRDDEHIRSFYAELERQEETRQQVFDHLLEGLVDR